MSMEQAGGVEFSRIAVDLLSDATNASVKCRNEGNALLKRLQSGIREISNEHSKSAARTSSAITASSHPTIHISRIIPIMSVAHQALNSYACAIRVLQKAMTEVATAERKWNHDCTPSSVATSSKRNGENDHRTSAVPSSAIVFIARVKGLINALLAAASNYLFAVHSLCVAKATILLLDSKESHIESEKENASTSGEGRAVVKTAKPVSLLSIVLCESLVMAVRHFEASECELSLADEEPLGGGMVHEDDNEAKEFGLFDRFRKECLGNDGCLVIGSNTHSRSGSGSSSQLPSLVPSDVLFVKKSVSEAQRVIDLYRMVVKYIATRPKSDDLLISSKAQPIEEDCCSLSSGDALLAGKLLLRVCRLRNPLIVGDAIGDAREAREAYKTLLGGASPSYRRDPSEGNLYGCSLDPAALGEATTELASIERLYF